jgi:hypothetical protein
MDLFEWADQNKASAVDEKPAGRPEIRNEEGKLRTMLERLSAGPLSTFEAERLDYNGQEVHRGQAVIGSLRAQGYLIDLVMIDGVNHYVLRGKVNLVRVTPTMQDRYYATKHWRNLAAERKEHDGYTCQQCGSKDDLETHHWRYRLFAESLLHDLITFCKACHQAIHEACRGSSIHFPRQVSEEIANQIEAEHDDYPESDF